MSSDFVLPLLESDDLVVERGKMILFEDLPDRSIALDGYVQGPAIDAARMRFSFDHHASCIRHVTRATCAQVLDALRVGLRASGYRVFVNDVDADTVVAVWLLARDARVGILNQRGALLESIAHLVETVSLRDALGPAVGGYDRVLADRVWLDVMAPLNDAKRDKTYATCDLRALLRECVTRLDEWIGSGCDARYAQSVARMPMARPTPCDVAVSMVVDSIALASSDGYGAFERLYALGHDRCVVYSQLADGTYKYTIGKRSEFVDGFPVGPASDPTTILGRLAAREPGWGGGTTIGGSPRNADGSGSRIVPADVLVVALEACGYSSTDAIETVVLSGGR